VHAWKAQWYDGLFSIITFVATLITAPHLDKGIIIGVLLSLGMFLYKSMRPKVTTLSMYADRSFKSARDYGLKECRHIALVRFDGSLFYANAGYLEEKITERLRVMPELRHSHRVSWYDGIGRIGRGNALNCGQGAQRRLRNFLRGLNEKVHGHAEPLLKKSVRTYFLVFGAVENTPWSIPNGECPLAVWWTTAKEGRGTCGRKYFLVLAAQDVVRGMIRKTGTGILMMPHS
jgi:hypothetical protein